MNGRVWPGPEAGITDFVVVWLCGCVAVVSWQCGPLIAVAFKICLPEVSCCIDTSWPARDPLQVSVGWVVLMGL